MRALTILAVGLAAIGCDRNRYADHQKFIKDLDLARTIVESTSLELQSLGGREEAGMIVGVYKLDLLYDIPSGEDPPDDFAEQLGETIAERLRSLGAEVVDTEITCGICYTEASKADAPDSLGYRLIYRWRRAQGVIMLRLTDFPDTLDSSAYLAVSHVQLRR